MINDRVKNKYMNNENNLIVTSAVKWCVYKLLQKKIESETDSLALDALERFADSIESDCEKYFLYKCQKKQGHLKAYVNLIANKRVIAFKKQLAVYKAKCLGDNNQLIFWPTIAQESALRAFGHARAIHRRITDQITDQTKTEHKAELNRQRVNRHRHKNALLCDAIVR
ncbi:MAG: hypothetical protein NUV65_00815 [Candidatus Roizmanbacteria bacterium]|nr:hypothetical protein [Candidatus Roizmanbacteria bacterium]